MEWKGICMGIGVGVGVGRYPGCKRNRCDWNEMDLGMNKGEREERKGLYRGFEMS